MKTKIARYKIIKKLGEGGMGIVYKAYDPDMDRVVALKILSDQLKNKEKARDRFEQEYKIMAALSHRAIVSVHDSGEHNDLLYFVMPYMDGGSLADRLQNGPMSCEEVQKLLSDLGAALDKVHEHNLIHCDINPANILFDRDGRLYLADFGIARRVVEDIVTPIGTEAYMSPEQRTGKNLDRRSDVFQLGMVLFKMLTGKLADPDNIQSVYDYNPNLPPGCDKIIARALATKKEDRYATAGDLTTELSAVLKGSEGKTITSIIKTGSTDTKANSTPPWPIIRSGILFGLIILAFFTTAYYFKSPAPPIGLIISFTPSVDVKHHDSLKEAQVGLRLYEDDVVIAQANANAIISTFCLEKTLIFSVKEQQNMQVNCDNETYKNLIKEFKLEEIHPEWPSLLVLPGQEEDPSREVEAQTPVLLTPRNTLIRDTQPTFQWQGVPGASGYRISLNIPNAENWEVETTETTLPYPADKAPLPAGGRIFVKLATLDNPAEIEETFVKVIDQDSAKMAELAASEAEIRNLGVDETAQAYLLAQLYRQQEMNAAAIAQLEQIAAKEEAISADFWQQLGNLYFEIRLYTKAEEKYKNALSAAQANNDEQIEALAHFGLAQTAYVFKENEQALDYLNQAEALSAQIGNNALAEAVADLKEKIEQ